MQDYLTSILLDNNLIKSSHRFKTKNRDQAPKKDNPTVLTGFCPDMSDIEVDIRTDENVHVTDPSVAPMSSASEGGGGGLRDVSGSTISISRIHENAFLRLRMCSFIFQISLRSLKTYLQRLRSI